jgi:hypothetical protein
VTIQGLQVLPLSFAEFDKGLFFNITSVDKLPTRRVGYAYFFDVSQRQFGKRFLLLRGAVYTPGTFLSVPHNYSTVQKNCQVEVEWDVAGLAVTVYY